MESVRIHEYGGADVLRVDEADRPEPAPDEVLIEVVTVGVNPVDIHVREGYRATPDELDDLPGPEYRGLATPEGLPRILGADLAGTVHEVGEEVDRFSVGDRVFGTGLHNDRMGTYAEYTVARPDRIAHLPSNVSFEVGGAAGAVSATAWRALIHHGSLSVGEGCLIHGATGGLGHVAVQLANHAGARVVGTARPEVHDVVRSWGAEAVVDYEHPDVVGEVRRALDGGPSVILDHMAGTLVPLDMDVAAFDGQVVIVGGPQDEVTVPSTRTGMQKDLTLRFIGVSNTPVISDVLQKIARLLSEGDLTVDIHETYPLADAAASHRSLENDQFVGKLVLLP